MTFLLLVSWFQLGLAEVQGTYLGKDLVSKGQLSPTGSSESMRQGSNLGAEGGATQESPYF